MYTTATIEKNERQNSGKILFVVSFTGDKSEPEVRKDFIVTADTQAFKNLLIAEISNLNAALGLTDLLVGQPVDLTPPDPPPPPEPDPPTPKELFSIKVDLLRQMEKAIESKIKLATDQDYIDLQAEIKVDLAANPDWIDVF